MRTIGSLLTILLVLSPAFSKNQPPEPQDNQVNLEGFLTQGGVVNMIEGEAAYTSPDAPPQTILPNQQLKNGDAIQTGHNGRAEILLNPGYFLRLSANTRIVFLDFAPGNLALKVTSGSAIIEIVTVETLYTYFGWEEPDPAYSIFYDSISVSFPQNRFSTVTGGIYRIDVDPDHETELRVAKGRAFFAGHRVEKGESASFRSGAATVAKLQADETDAFDVWSRDRAEFLVKTNQSLKRIQPFRAIRANVLSYLNIEFDDEDEELSRGRTVSVLGGLVSFIQPGVFVLREGEQWTRLEPRAELKYGDRVRTDADGRAQINLYGTCSLFLGTNTEIIYGVRPDGDVAVKVLQGSALVLFAYGDKEKAARPVISFATPQIEYEILRDGIYQLTAGSNESEMNVYNGRVRVAGREIKKNKKVVFRNSQQEIHDLSKKSRDSLYVWSLKRASALTRSRRVRLNGIWYFHSAANVHTYVPGTRVFRSPYGGEYQVQLMRRFRPRFPGRFDRFP
ncbi:MAG: hypothetical protein WAQ99_13910 [Pyrinomonadaceae bacterium]